VNGRQRFAAQNNLASPGFGRLFSNNTKVKKKEVLMVKIAFLAFLPFLILFTVASCGDSSSTNDKKETSTESSSFSDNNPTYDGFGFRLFDERVSDSAIKTEVEQKVVVDGIPTKEGIEKELLYRFRKISSRTGFRYHENPTSIFIYVYGSEEQARAGGWTWVGMIGKSAAQTTVPKVDINEDRFADLSSPPEEKFGFSEEERKEIFHKIVDAEDRARNEANAKIPDTKIMEQINLQNELAKKYKEQVAKKYGLTDDQLSDIGLEGVIKGWPF